MVWFFRQKITQSLQRPKSEKKKTCRNWCIHDHIALGCSGFCRCFKTVGICMGNLKKSPVKKRVTSHFGCNAAIFWWFLAASVHQQLWKLSIFHEILLFLLLLPLLMRTSTFCDRFRTFHLKIYNVYNVLSCTQTINGIKCLIPDPSFDCDWIIPDPYILNKATKRTNSPAGSFPHVFSIWWMWP